MALFQRTLNRPKKGKITNETNLELNPLLLAA